MRSPARRRSIVESKSSSRLTGSTSRNYTTSFQTLKKTFTAAQAQKSTQQSSFWKKKIFFYKSSWYFFFFLLLGYIIIILFLYAKLHLFEIIFILKRTLIIWYYFYFLLLRITSVCRNSDKISILKMKL